MNKEQIKKYLTELKEMLEAMKQDKVDASAYHEETSELMRDIEEDIYLCSLTINNLTKKLITKRG